MLNAFSYKFSIGPLIANARIYPEWGIFRIFRTADANPDGGWVLNFSFGFVKYGFIHFEF